MNDDALSEIRRKVAALSPDELQAVLAGILGGGLAGVAPVPPTPPSPTVHDAPAEAALLTVRVDVDATRPPVWRRLALHGDLALDEVHAILQAAFGWQDYHLHRFWAGPAKQIWRGPFFVTEQDLEEGEEGVPESEVRLDQVLRSPGDRLFYTYDFGDGWTHTIRLEAVTPLDPGSPPAVCTGGRMAGPLEDCGGPDGHNELVEAFRADPGLSGLDPDRRAWLPEDWDPVTLDLDEVALRLSLVGLTTDEVLAALAARAGPAGPVELPDGLEPLLDLAPPAVAAELAQLCIRARTGPVVELTPEDLAVISRPYRYLVDLAGNEGIPLTAAGWMRPAYVERIYRDLGFEEDWIGKGNREDQTQPVARLRAMCQQLGLLRKHKGRLVRTPLARSLSTDEEYVAALAGRLLRDRDPFVRAGLVLFALLTVDAGRAVADHADVVADLMSACGLRTGPEGVSRWDALGWVRPVWLTLADASGRTFRNRHDEDHVGDHRAVALALAALWPEALTKP